MASMRDELTCPICCGIFADPVVLGCSHSFCRACLKQCRDRGALTMCPVCRAPATDKPPRNLALRNLCEMYLTQQGTAASGALCPLHGETLKLFCLQDEEPVCFVCQTSEKHERHKLRPVQEVAEKLKEDLRGQLWSSHEKLKVFQRVKHNYDQTSMTIKSQSDRIGRQMREEFEKLHKFLRDEENSRIASLMEEEKKKGELVKRKTEALTKDMESLSRSIRSIEEEMRCEDITFLQRYKDAKKMARGTVQVPDEAPFEDMDVSKHLDKLKDTVMERMLQVFQYPISKLVLSMPNPPVPPVQSCSLSLRNNPSSLPRTAEASMARQRLTKAPPLPAPSGRVGPLPHATPPLPIATPPLPATLRREQTSTHPPSSVQSQQAVTGNSRNTLPTGQQVQRPGAVESTSQDVGRAPRHIPGAVNPLPHIPSLTWGPPTSHGGQTGIRLPVSAQRPRAEAGHGRSISLMDQRGQHPATEEPRLSFQEIRERFNQTGQPFIRPPSTLQRHRQ